MTGHPICETRRRTAARFRARRGHAALGTIALLAVTGLGTLAAMAQAPTCTKATAPPCALARVPFESESAADTCRKEMLSFRDEMEKYASCLSGVSPGQEQAARNEYEDVRVRFNKRAREEFD